MEIRLIYFAKIIKKNGKPNVPADIRDKIGEKKHLLVCVSYSKREVTKKAELETVQKSQPQSHEKGKPSRIDDRTSQ